MTEILTMMLAVLVTGLFVIPALCLLAIAGLTGLPWRWVSACRRTLTWRRT